MAVADEPWTGLSRVYMAFDIVKDRLRRAAAALDAAAVPYVVIGGNAVGEWVGRADPSSIRLTQDVDILLRRSDLPAAKTALEAVGFVYRHAASIDMFLDGAGARARDSVHVIFANEKVRPEYEEPAPDVSEMDSGTNYRLLALDALVRMKLTSFRDKDRLHVRDLIGVGLVDATWPARFSPVLAARLQQLLDDPDG